MRPPVPVGGASIGLDVPGELHVIRNQIEEATHV
jgi:hypothetical protein